MPRYSNFIKGKSMVVLGTIKPCLEAIALDAGASKQTQRTGFVKYNQKFCE